MIFDTLKSQSSMDVQQVEHHLLIFSAGLVELNQDSFSFLDTNKSNCCLSKNYFSYFQECRTSLIINVL